MKRTTLPLFVGALTIGTLGLGTLAGCGESSEPKTPPQAEVKADSPLIGTMWELELDSLQNVPADADKPGRDITLQIDADHRVAGSGGVNRYFGPVTLDEAAETIKFGNLASTMMAGPGMNYESTYLKALDTVDGYQISGEELVLTAGGKPVLKFEAVEAENDGNADQ